MLMFLVVYLEVLKSQGLKAVGSSLSVKYARKVAHFCLMYVYKFGDSLPSSCSLLTLALPGVSVLLGHQSWLTSFHSEWGNADVSVPGGRVRRTFIVDLSV